MSFYLKTAVLSVAITLLSNVLPFFEGASSFPIWYCVILIYALLTIFSWRWILKAHKGSAIKFTTAVNGITALKMLLTLIIITSYLVSHFWQRTKLFYSQFCRLRELFPQSTAHPREYRQ